MKGNLVLLCYISTLRGNTLDVDDGSSRIVILGDFMSGRIDIGNVLLGRDKNHDKTKHEECFSSLNGIETASKRTCVDKGYWLGKENSEEKITIIDTPTFKSWRESQLILDDLKDTLKREVKFANIFIIAFKQKLTNRLVNQLSSLEKFFGEQIWNHTIFLVPSHRYGAFDSDESQQSLNLKVNEEFQNKFQTSRNLPSVFIDCTKERYSEKESEIFQNQTKILLDFINTRAKKFDFKNIDMASTEIETLNKRIEILVNTNKERDYLIRNLTEHEHEKLFSLVDYSLIVCGGSIVLGVIIALAIVCIDMFKKRKLENNHNSSINISQQCTCDPEGAQDMICSVCSQRNSDDEDCLAYCGLSSEDIVTVQRRMFDA